MLGTGDPSTGGTGSLRICDVDEKVDICRKSWDDGDPVESTCEVYDVGCEYGRPVDAS